jgi:NADPH2:quinone reductase
MFWTIRNLVFFMQVIAATGSDEKCKLAMQRGAQFSVNYSQGSLKEAVKELVGRSGVNVAIDMVGGDIFLEALRRCVQWSVQLGLC